jgi:D-alanyl-D-alanine carboxypeptidase
MRALDDHFQEVLRTGVPGVVAVASGPDFSWKAAAGVADAETGAALTTDHRFRIASVTKLFVAAVVLQLVDEDALALDGEVGSIAQGVTVRQLLNHTSGLPHPHGDDILSLFEPYRKDRAYRPESTPSDVLALIQSKPRLFPPGEGWFYSGSNYVVLGLIIEETTGATLREELQRRILEPLGLGATDLPDAFPTPTGLARAYLPPDNPVLPEPGPGLVDVTDIELSTWGGSGMVSTARDIARFLGALLGGEIFPPTLGAELLSSVVSDWEESDGYGLGIEEVSSIMGKVESTCGSAWGHLGFSTGYTTIALASKTGDRQVVICLNTYVMSDVTWTALGSLVWAGFCG